MTRRLRLVAVGLLALAVALPLGASSSEARPGGGQTFGSGSRKSGGSSSRPSGFSPSRRSSGSGSRPSSGGGVAAAPARRPVHLHRATSGRERRAAATVWAPGRSVFDAPPPRPAAWPASREYEGSSIGALLLVIASMVLMGVGGFVWIVARVVRRSRGSGWSTGATPSTRPASARSELEAIRAADPDFSVALFEDFLYALYAEAQVTRATPRLERLAPWLRPAVRHALASRSPAPATTVVIGAMRVVELGTSDPARWHVRVELEANYAERGHGGHESAFWVTERWTLSRARGARSRPPDRARVLDCPGCGGALDKIVGGTCRYCQRVVDTGELDWVVDAVQVTHLERRGPMLTGTTEERGGQRPTIVDPLAEQRLAALRARDPAFDPQALQQRVRMIFDTMQSAWSSLEWDRARPFLGDNLFHAQRYWIEAYRRSGLRNVTEGARILRIDLARVTQDRWFDAITLRVHATGLDYTLRLADGAVVGGDRRRERPYSEYWTLLRGVAARGPTRVAPECPGCGAGLEVSMAAICKHCGAKVSSGEHDWVLSRIEQDEVYDG